MCWENVLGNELCLLLKIFNDKLVLLSWCCPTKNFNFSENGDCWRCWNISQRSRVVCERAPGAPTQLWNRRPLRSDSLEFCLLHRDGGSPPCLWRRHRAFCPSEKPNFRFSFLLSGLGCFLVATFVLNPANQVTGGRGEQKGLDPWEPPPGCKEEPTDSDDEDGSAPISSDATHSPQKPTWCLIHRVQNILNSTGK